MCREREARRAAMPPQAAEPPAPVVEPKLAPETQARIDRAWNEYVAEQDGARAPRPRITRL
ncbi:MAG: hypothetical protein QOD09_335 [Bradyrhizobium sp.]|jgi:hypothetical protein|nr:hypothetical protein [Bradyrhizobium sp.]